MTLAPLSQDALAVLGHGLHDRQAPSVPDGPRHYHALQELFACGFIEWIPTGATSPLAPKKCLGVSDRGRAYYRTAS